MIFSSNGNRHNVKRTKEHTMPHINANAAIATAIVAAWNTYNEQLVAEGGPEVAPVQPVHGGIVTLGEGQLAVYVREQDAEGFSHWLLYNTKTQEMTYCETAADLPL